MSYASSPLPEPALRPLALNRPPEDGSGVTTKHGATQLSSVVTPASPDPAPAGRTPATPGSTAPLPTESWLKWHSAGMVLAIAATVGFQLPELLAGYAAASFSLFLFRWRGRYTDDGTFGVANTVTSVRLLLTLLLLVSHPWFPDILLASVACVTLLLDGVDGWLARRRNLSSEFGACYDVEVDSILVVTLPLLLIASGKVAPWLALVGLWRYAYVLSPLILRDRGGPARRSRFGRTIYAAMIACFLLALGGPPAFAEPLTTFGVLIVSLSFIRSFWQRFAPYNSRSIS